MSLYYKQCLFNISYLIIDTMKRLPNNGNIIFYLELPNSITQYLFLQIQKCDNAGVKNR